MNVEKTKIMTRMIFDKDVRKSFFEIYSIFKEDENFSLKRLLIAMRNMAKGEKIVRFEGKYIISPFLPPFPSKAFIENILAVNEPTNIFTQQIRAKRRAPISIYLCLTNKCPNNCVYCSAKHRDREGELTTEEWIKVIKDLQDMKTSIIGLTGGDPMMRDDIFDIVGAIDERSASILFTSGINLTPEKARELKKRGLFSVGISLDSYDKDTHNKNRNSDKAFDYAVKAMQTSRSAGLYTLSQTVVLRENLDEEELFKLFKFAGENGAHEVKILEPVLSGNLLSTKDLSKIMFTEEDRKKLIAIQHKANKKRDLPKITTFAYTESEEKYGCGAGTQHSYISAAGDLYPCDFVPMSFGSVKETSVAELWREMNGIIGAPKIGCFGQAVNKEVYERANGKLPLCKEESTEICKRCRSETLPKYYRDLQGLGY
ncbi:MAG TPA: radical SAM protein [Spirochaetota bacterium]|nr:radical SAM protein [Spirochaetota bacterium]HOS33188.1 radical SAM protein [Spirochaetota bacterium]HOS56428.1 radical SAM protein [Spirochaetota bacterium]HPK61353.1 radical SAM protein [Spirochaetota bacterium]HQF78270.1 radical SAM protein [Spirochaetota bacterium]